MTGLLHLLGPARWLPAAGAAVALGPTRRHQLLARLGQAHDWVARETLAALFWPDRSARAARGNLRKVLHELRATGVQGIEEGPQGLRWLVPSDLAAFDAALARGDWSAAATLGVGRPMENLDGGGDAFDRWLSGVRDAHAARWRDAVLRAGTATGAAGAYAAARTLLEADALDEDAMALAWRAAQALGLQDEARTLWRRHREQLAAELGGAPSAALVDLIESAWRDTPPIDPLIGRRAELQRLARLLEQGRLVTLVGAGGVGKTRLARCAARAAATGHAEGATFVALDDLTTPTALPTRIASALGLRLAARDDPLAALARALAARSLLLVLDGFESVIDAGPAVHALLAAAPGLRVLATSRERLDVEGEWLLPLDGLAEDEATTLFAERARALGRALDGDADRHAAAAICQALGGWPLAIELAASWTRVLTPAAIAEDLARGPALLSADGTLAAVFDRSWRLLTVVERQALTRLAVFRGGFTREAAQQVAQVTLPVLGALVDKSMLRRSADGRFDLHAVLAAHVGRHLAALPDREALALAHSLWYLQRVSDDPAAEPANVLAAWQHAVARHDDAAVDAALAVMPRGFVTDGRLAEAAALFDAAARQFGEASATAAHLRAQQAWMLLWLERYAEAEAGARAALQQLDAVGHGVGGVMALRVLGHAARRRGRADESAGLLTQALQRARRAGLQRLVPALQDALAMTLILQGRHGEARVQLLEALAANQASGDETQLMYNQFNLSQSHSLEGRPRAALPWCTAALATAQRAGQDFFVPYARCELALVTGALQRRDEARLLAAQALEAACATGDRAAQAWAHEVIARQALARGDTSAARAAVAAAAERLRGSGNVAMAASLRPVAEQAYRGADEDLAALLAGLDPGPAGG